jgi:hypothetical protein
MTIKDARPYLEVIQEKIDKVKAVPEHPIVNEEARDYYLGGLVDAKMAILDLVEQSRPLESFE